MLVTIEGVRRNNQVLRFFDVVQVSFALAVFNVVHGPVVANARAAVGRIHVSYVAEKWNRVGAKTEQKEMKIKHETKNKVKHVPNQQNM